MVNRVSLPELCAADIRLRPTEAVAIVVAVARRHADGDLPGIPSPAVIRLTRAGAVEIEGPVPAVCNDVAGAAQLLQHLLPGFDAPPEYRVSGALRLVIARALHTLDLPPYASVAEFCAALARFTAADVRATLADLFRAWEHTPAAAAAAHAPIPRRSRVRWVAVPVTAAAAIALAVVSLNPREHPPVRPPAPAVPEAAAPVAQAAAAAVAAPPREPSVRWRRTPAVTTRGPSMTGQEAPRLVQAMAYSPAFSASGRTVYFHEQRGGASALKRAETDLTDGVTHVSSIVDDRSLNFHPRPSPDGSLIAFDSDREGVRAVFVARADGAAVRRVSGAGFGAVPTWSPDGGRLAFVKSEPRSPRTWNLWTARVDGSDLRQVTSHRVGQAWGGSWFPDGRHIAYSVETRLVILDLATGAQRQFASPRPGHLVRTPAVSPDGTRIIFQVHHDGTWVMDASSGAMRRVLADATAEEFTWSPDGRRVAFHSHRTGTWSVWMMAP